MTRLFGVFAILLLGVTSPSPATITVTTTADSGPGSLRQAILDANSNPGMDTISFSIGSGTQTLTPATALPTIMDPVLVDGTTQPGFSGTPLIELNGLNVQIGLTITAGNSIVRGLVVNRCVQVGILLWTGGGNTVEGCFLGTNVAGTGAPGVQPVGVLMSDSADNFIGGTSPGSGNLISGNSDVGVHAAGVAAAGNKIQGNLIGTDVTGLAALGNSLFGVAFASPSGSNNSVGGTTAAARNVISGNGLPSGGGAGIVTWAAGTVIQGNFIGTDATGTVPLANNRSGVTIGTGASGALIGGAVPGAGNIISGNEAFGIEDAGVGTVIQGNYVGTGLTGSAGIPNVLAGIFVGGSNALIGGTVAGAGNTVSGNNIGIRIDRFSGLPAPTGNQIQGNRIGTQADGVSPLGNLQFGIWLRGSASDNSIGGSAAGAGNVVAYNSQAGVELDTTASTGNAILSNSIYSNGALGIDLAAAGVTPNDAGDGDTGPNNLQNFPTLSSAVNTGFGTTVQGSLQSTPSSSFRIELFSDPTGDPSGHGQGKTFLGFTNVTTDPAGDATFSLNIPTPVFLGHRVSATATDAGNNTSEFSLSVPVSQPILTINNVTISEGDAGSANATFTVSLTPNSDLLVTVDYATADVSASAGSDYVAAAGTLTFTPGTSTKQVVVVILGDLIDELDETFVVTLSGALNATIANGQGLGTILDDDPPPTLSIGDATATEGAGVLFTVTLSAVSGQTVTVNYDTADGSAAAGSDYGASSGMLTFTPGTISRTILVSTFADAVAEPTETFFVNLSGAVNSTIVDGQGLGTLLNGPLVAGSVSPRPAGYCGSTGLDLLWPLGAGLVLRRIRRRRGR